MFKQIMTMIRGRQQDAAEAFTDAQAIPLLRQQMRDAAGAVDASRRAVAVAMAQGEAERKQQVRLAAQIDDLETRALDALRQGQDALAEAAAETLAHLESERDTAARAAATFGAEITRLRQGLAAAEARLRALERGQRLAVATDQTQRLRRQLPSGGPSALAEAEATLKRLEARQGQLDATDAAMSELDHATSAEALRDRLAEAGCGAPVRPDAGAVLARLKSRLQTPEPQSL